MTFGLNDSTTELWLEKMITFVVRALLTVMVDETSLPTRETNCADAVQPPAQRREAGRSGRGPTCVPGFRCCLPEQTWFGLVGNWQESFSYIDLELKFIKNWVFINIINYIFNVEIIFFASCNILEISPLLIKNKKLSFENLTIDCWKFQMKRKTFN